MAGAGRLSAVRGIRACSTTSQTTCSTASLEKAVASTIENIHAHPTLLREVLASGDERVRHAVLSNTVADAFHEADSDGDGNITRDEQARFISRYPSPSPASHSSAPAAEEDPATYVQLRRHALLSFLPFVAFGFLDNVIMIVAGDRIDETFGAAFTLSTMAAAGLGNTLSDVIGVGASGYIEQTAMKVLPGPGLTRTQASSSSARLVGQLAQALGIAVGCILGISPLLVMDDEATRKLKKLYEAMDKDRDGFVSFGELENARSLGARTRPPS